MVVMAQPFRFTRHKSADAPTVYIISVRESDTLYRSNSPMTPREQMLDVTSRNAAVRSAIGDHRAATRRGFQSLGEPSAIFADREGKFSFAFGGFVALRAAYGFDRAIDNIDMVPYDIPMGGGNVSRQQLQMDASTSRLYLRGIANSSRLGKVEIFFDVDFRGRAAGSYTPRLRSGYVSMLGLTVGRDVTTFCDLEAAPTTIDFQGPNAYNYNFATMIRYEHSFIDNHLKIGVAAEIPKVSGTYGTMLAPVPQRVPDVPVYLQYAWGDNRQSHIRASGVFRNMYLYNEAREVTSDLFGWGVQFSGTIHVTPFIQLFMNGVYGEGITPYLQDLTGSGLDFTPNPSDEGRVQTMPMYGWQAAAQINILPNLFISGGYSAVTVCKKNGYYTADQYRMGQYIFGNVFYNVTRRFCIAAEYLWAKRENMSGVSHHANRVNLLAKYNF